MARNGFAAVTVPSSLWEQDELLDVLARRDIGQLFRILQKTTGATQTQIGTAIGLSQAQVSEVMSGARKVASIDVITRIAAGFHIPDPARMTLFLGQRQTLQRPAPRQRVPEPSELDEILAKRYSDVTAVYPSRSAFASAHPVHALFDGTHDIRAAGLSLNLLCQQYPDTSLYQLAESGTRLRLLLLDPDGDAIRQREREEGHQPHFLSSLNNINLDVLRRVVGRLPSDKQSNMQVAIYDQTIRFNIILIDERLCIVQPYLPHSRGVESPTIVIKRNPRIPGLYPMFEQVFTTAWEGSRQA